MDARAYLLECRPRIEGALDRALPPAEEPPETLHRAMRHLLFPGGKYLRPALALAAAEAVGSPPEPALRFATAVELVHTYSLIHDDLPCMDDDAERRGRPAVHVAFGEAVAVLAGDALLALAFDVLSRSTGEPQRVLRASRDLAMAAGSRFLVGGQVADLDFEGDAAAIEWVHARKTAALIGVAISGGARLGGADDRALARLRRFGYAIGVAFQIADDLLDECEEDACSLLRVMDPGAARARAEELLAEGLEAIEELGEPAERLRELARYAVRRSE